MMFLVPVDFGPRLLNSDATIMVHICILSVFSVQAESGVGLRHAKQPRGGRQRRKRVRGGRRTARPDAITHSDDEERLRFLQRHLDTDEEDDDNNDVDQHSVSSRRDGQFVFYLTLDLVVGLLM